MRSENFGAQEFTEEDRAYRGSCFSEVRNALFANPYQGPLPIYEVSLSRIIRGILPFGQSHFFRKACERTLDSTADLRWGKDGKGFRRLLHPNGVCLTGLWEITEETGYSGYFRKGSKALLVGRYSSSNSKTRRGQTRSLGFVGKLFPTTDPNHTEPLRTANFITQLDLGGEKFHYINDVEFRNAPDTHTLRSGIAAAPFGVVSVVVFMLVDKKIMIRQLYPIAELGKPEGEPTRTPKFMRLLVAPDQMRIEDEALDVRDEILAQIFDKGDPTPKRTLTYHIEVTDEGSTRGVPGLQRLIFRNWRYIGKMTFDNAVASYNGDFVLHFNHPTWRDDPNDPTTATRVNGRKVRRRR
jgi:hypothetical protein